MGDEREGVHGVVVDLDVELHEVRWVVAADLIVERRIAFSAGFELIEEVHQDFVQGQLVEDHHAIFGRVFGFEVDAPTLAGQVHHRTDIGRGNDDAGGHIRLVHAGDLGGWGQVCRIVHLDDLAVGQMNLVDDARSGCDQGQVELTLQPLLHNVQVQQA